MSTDWAILAIIKKGAFSSFPTSNYVARWLKKSKTSGEWVEKKLKKQNHCHASPSSDVFSIEKGGKGKRHPLSSCIAAEHIVSRNDANISLFSRLLSK